MKLFNTLTRKIEEVRPLQGKNIKLFVCGPTVYDLVHIGNAKTYVQFDVLARVLRQQGFEVDYLQNITDIDDKIITRAKEQEISWEELRDEYEAEYMRDMKSLNNTSVTKYARATDYIDNIIHQVKALMDNGHAYKIDDGIYFEIATFPEYGKLSGRTEIKENDAETRIDQSDQKKGWNDFCLWKFSKPGEPVWKAPFGEGRPGWHIEDTAITEHRFGPQYDMHGGAVDLIFPHHEAEITQMESLSGKVPFVRHWVHTGFLNVDNAKMSKSAGNFHTIRDVLDKGYDPMALRLLMLQTHYRSPINFTWENLDSAQNRLNTFQAMADLRWQTIGTASWLKNAVVPPMIFSPLYNDLNTPLALAGLNDFAANVQNYLISDDDKEKFIKILQGVDEVFGLDLLERNDINKHQKQIIADYEKARQKKNYAQSDKLRAQLREEQGLDIRDAVQGTIWTRL